jgi:acyl dehydratase
MQYIVGSELPSITTRFTRADLVRYAGASGDLNIIHWNERAALAVGLPGVIAHGMLTMGHAIRVVTQWVGDPTRVSDYQVRVTRPVVVPDDEEGAEVTFSGTVTAVRDDGSATVPLSAVFDGATVLARATATVKP